MNQLAQFDDHNSAIPLNEAAQQVRRPKFWWLKLDFASEADLLKNIGAVHAYCLMLLLNISWYSVRTALGNQEIRIAVTIAPWRESCGYIDSLYFENHTTHHDVSSVYISANNQPGATREMLGLTFEAPLTQLWFFYLR